MRIWRINLLIIFVILSWQASGNYQESDYCVKSFLGNVFCTNMFSYIRTPSGLKLVFLKPNLDISGKVITKNLRKSFKVHICESSKNIVEENVSKLYSFDYRFLVETLNKIEAETCLNGLLENGFAVKSFDIENLKHLRQSLFKFLPIDLVGRLKKHTINQLNIDQLISLWANPLIKENYPVIYTHIQSKIYENAQKEPGKTKSKLLGNIGLGLMDATKVSKNLKIPLYREKSIQGKEENTRTDEIHADNPKQHSKFKIEKASTDEEEVNLEDNAAEKVKAKGKRRNKHQYLGKTLKNFSYNRNPSPGSLWEHTIISRKKENFRLCILGDSGAEKPYEFEALKYVHQDLKDNCDQINILGDIIYPKGPNTLEDISLKVQFLDHYGKINDIPIYLLLGNHEYYNIKKLDLWFAVPHKAKRMNPRSDIRIPHYFYGQIIARNKNEADICLVNLDTTPLYYAPLYDNASQVASDAILKQDQWLQSSYSVLNGCGLVLALGHHGYFSPGSSRARTGWWHFMDKFIMDKADILIAGHEHFIGYWEKTPEMIWIRKNKGNEEYSFGQSKKISQVIVGSGGKLFRYESTGNNMRKIYSQHQIVQKNGYLKVSYNSNSNSTKFELITLTPGRREIFKTFVLTRKVHKRYPEAP